ncbi:MAG: ABC transporter permease [Parachlamydiaceae bacterium]|nr:ABC transporter permease [Parachlamydiaceae bacterium]
MMWKRFCYHRLGVAALIVVAFFCLVGIYAPLLASSRPLFVVYDGQAYFPLFRYLFYTGFFTKRLDLFFNLMIVTFPLLVGILWLAPRNIKVPLAISILLAHLSLFAFLVYMPLIDPAGDVALAQKRTQAIRTNKEWLPSWAFELQHITPYARLNLVLRHQQRLNQHERLLPYSAQYATSIQNSVLKDKQQTHLPTLWQMEKDHEEQELQRLKASLESTPNKNTEAQLQYLVDRRQWLNEQLPQLKHEVMPLVTDFHWEDDAGGQQALNYFLPWWELTRINRKNLLAALIFGVRISLTVGIIAVGLSLLVGIPIGAYSGYYGGKIDIIVSRLIEIWEAMPVFFMLLMVVALLQSKSIFLVTAVIGFFGWTQFSRYIRGEFFKQRNLSYVEACHSLGFRDSYIMFKHILPNAMPPVLTLLPFAIMAAITSEAGLSFLGLGEEGSCSWGVLMDEGRSAFPAESYLLWPPAILLTVFLIAIALVGDSLRDTLDPKL